MAKGNNELLRTENLTKDFGRLRAVDHLSLSLHEGEIRGLIGPNGSGKTTVVNLITGVYRPTSGGVYFSGADPRPVWSGRIADISAGGCQVIADEDIAGALEIGDVLGVRISFGAGADVVYADARFRRADDINEGYLLGLQFLGAR